MTELAKYIASKRKSPAAEPKGPRLSRQKRKRMNVDTEYLAVRDIDLENNPHCCEPDCPKPATEKHHLAGGPNRGATLTNMDLTMNGCHEHHEAWGDRKRYPIEKQFAMKFKATLRRYAEMTGKRVDAADVAREMRKSDP